MTVDELIQFLKTCPRNAQVHVNDENGGHYFVDIDPHMNTAQEASVVIAVNFD